MKRDTYRAWVYSPDRTSVELVEVGPKERFTMDLAPDGRRVMRQAYGYEYSAPYDIGRVHELWQWDYGALPPLRAPEKPAERPARVKPRKPVLHAVAAAPEAPGWRTEKMRVLLAGSGMGR